MNNEEKILSLLENLTTKVDKLEQGQAGTNQRLDRIEGDVKVIKEDIVNIKEDIEIIKEDIEIIKEDAEITRVGTNTLLDWADRVEGIIGIPLLNK